MTTTPSANGRHEPAKLTLAAVQDWLKKQATTAEIQAVKMTAQAIQNERFGAVGSHIVSGRIGK